MKDMQIAAPASVARATSGFALSLLIVGCASAPTPVTISGEVRQALGVITQVERGTTTDRGPSVLRSGLAGPVGSEIYKSAFTNADHIKYTILLESNRELLIESKDRLQIGDCVVVTLPAAAVSDQ